MGFNEFIGKLFGNKATRDMKEIKPWVDKVKAVYPEISDKFIKSHYMLVFYYFLFLLKVQR